MLSKNALRVLEKRYLARDEQGKTTEDAEGLFRRVARAIAEAEREFDPEADTEALADKMADKICGLRVFSDEAGKMNLNLAAAGGELLVVSQFTLYADLKSRRPGFTKAAPPAVAIPLYEKFMACCRDRGFHVEHGAFWADMAVSSVNDGPVTLCIEL